MIEVGQVLFVQTAGVALALDGDCVRARFPDATWRRLPLSRLDSVVVFGDVQLSTQLLCRCVEDGIPVAMLSPFGRPRAVVTGAGHANSVARHAQHLAHADPARRRVLAAQIVAGKIDNQRRVLDPLTRSGGGASARNASAALARLAERVVQFGGDDESDLATSGSAKALVRARSRLMGLEGAAARVYFRQLSAAVSAHSELTGPQRRQRRPCTDPFNATLSFGYALLATAVRGAVVCAGLDPAVGFLPGDRAEQPALVLDAMEEFRPAVDRWLLTLVNRRQLRLNHFSTHVSGAVELTEAGRDVALRAWHDLRVQASPSALLGGAAAPFAAQPLLQLRALSRCLTGDAKGYLAWSVR